MQNNDNQSQRFIYIRSLKEKIPCTEQQFKEFYREATRIRKKEQYYNRCKCPKQFIWACDGDCENCEHHLGYGMLSLDAPKLSIVISIKSAADFSISGDFHKRIRFAYRCVLLSHKFSHFVKVAM